MDWKIQDQETVIPYLSCYNDLMIALASSLVFLPPGSHHPTPFHPFSATRTIFLHLESDHDYVFLETTG